MEKPFDFGSSRSKKQSVELSIKRYVYRFLKLDSICAKVSKVERKEFSLLNHILTENGKGKFQVSDGGGEAAAAALPCRSVKLMRLDLMTSSLHFIDYRFKRRIGSQR